MKDEHFIWFFLFDFPSSFISNFRMETLIQQNEISAYSNIIKLSNLIKLYTPERLKYTLQRCMHPTVFLQNVASNAIAHEENVIISKPGIKSLYLRNHLQKFLKFIWNHIKSYSSHLVSVNFGLLYQNTKTLCRILYRKS